MLKQLSRSDLEQLLEQLAGAYRLQVPQQLADGTRQLAPYGSGKLTLEGEPLQRKPTSFFFPQTEVLLQLDSTGAVRLPSTSEKPLALFGLNAADLAGIAFIDRFFSAPTADDAYLRQRNGALLIGLTGAAGPDGSMLEVSAGNCDIELIANKEGWLALGLSATGKRLLEPFRAGDKDQLLALQQTSSSHSSNRKKNLQLASELLLNDLVPDEFWEEIADRCILCSGCNLACPTCTCFCIQDRQYGELTERSRVWDSCQLDAFMREASGHNPLGTEALRTRRRIHHKLAADPQRWGQLGCVACGRCDRACPTGIGIFALVEEMIKRYG